MICKCEDKTLDSCATLHQRKGTVHTNEVRSDHVQCGCKVHEMQIKIGSEWPPVQVQKKWKP